tara:strand:+ start:372 stop:596 length:225 start_codon:yes stop_codon:yes gene_type:complete
MSNKANYSIDDIGHFILGLLMDETVNDPTADVIKKLQRADIENCSPCIRLQEALIEEVKAGDAPFDESRLTGGK